ncbi:cell division protein FtsK [Pseudomonas sp. S35]|uniref:DNA translocase FtsK n=1 Tax=Pseudomonas sp. S35 TaxID=1573719 RepID=UPI00132F1151|nr:DNA translocase FtsK [Pseudomonas sp. S35]QHF45859.1 cell division protein FtsK [Pseudomonas sp. S35]
MKTEHRDIIERAKLAGVEPSYLAHELLVHDLVNAGLFELKNLHSPYGKLNEGQQQEVIDRMTKAATEAAFNAIAIISSRNVETIEVEVVDAKFKKKAITITASIDVNAPDATALAKVPGKMCLLVLAPTDYEEGLDFIQPDRDQKDLALHVSDLTGNLFPAGGTGADELASYDDTVPDGQDPLYSDAVVFVIESRRPSISAIQRKLKIGYNRAARMLEGMEQTGIVSAMNSNGAREVLRPVLTTPTGADEPDGEHPLGTAEDLAERTGGAGDTGADLGKEFGEFTYDDAAQLIVLKSNNKAFKAHWIQSRLAIDSDKAASLLIRLLDNGVIELEGEGETAMDHSYKVIATLADVT